MKKEGRLLKNKAVSSLLLSVEHFNGLQHNGRTEAVLILLDHSFEMLLKGSILHRGGKIRESRQNNTIGFDACVRKALSDASVKFINDEQALVLQTINGLRDAAQHHLLYLSEEQLYLHAQSGVTLFRDILNAVFDEELSTYLPDRVLPLATLAPKDTITLYSNELEEVRALLAPGRRKRTEAVARLRGLAIIDSALQGLSYQPGESDLRKLGNKVIAGNKLEDIFPGIAAVDFTTDGEGSKLSLRITKKEGIPVFLVTEGTPGATTVAIKRVDELGFYNLGRNQIAKQTGLSTAKTTAAIRLLKLKNNNDCYKQITIGKSKYDCYSSKAVDEINKLLTEKTPDQIWHEYRRLVSKVGGSPKS